MLQVGIAVKVFRSLLGVPALHDVYQEVLHQLAVGLGTVEIARLDLAVNLSAAGGVGLSDVRQVVPMLANLAVAFNAGANYLLF